MVSPSVGRTGTQDAPPEGRVGRVVERSLGLRDQDPAVLAGAASLLAAAVLTLAFPPSLLSVLLGAIAAAGLSREPRLGPLPAAFLALVAIPYGRAADNALAELAGIPVRFQDGVVLVAFLLALPTLRHISFRSGISRLIALFLLVGVAAVAIGLLEGNPWRDVLRDVRWWALYGFGLFALWGGIDRRAVVRQLAEAMQADMRPFEILLDLREDKAGAGVGDPGDPGELFAQYLVCIGRLIAFVDGLDGQRG